MFKKLSILFFMTLPALGAAAQDRKNELGLLLGAIHTGERTTLSGGKIGIGTGLAFQANYARRLVGDNTALFVEFPLLATPSTDVESALGGVPRNYASLFITPSARLAFNQDGGLSPWVSLGGGYGRIDSSTTLASGGDNAQERSVNTGTLQYGGGFDLRTPVRVLFPIGLRLEVRDFYSAVPRLNATTRNDRQHNVVFSGGIVLRF